MKNKAAYFLLFFAVVILFAGQMQAQTMLAGADAKLWSKAGWTTKTRHRGAYIEMPDGLKFVLVIFTKNFANEREIIPSIAGKILQNLK